PAWPNFAAALGVMGAKPVPVAMDLQNGVWSLDNGKLARAITSKTKAIFINSPCNPTGWTAELEQLADILKLARERDLWIIADEVYSRFFYGESKDRSSHRAASFYDLIDEDDKIIFVNTFSKNWAMTGWRVGWISAPPQLEQVFENLVQYSTSGVSAFMQRGAVAALNEGDDFTGQMVANCKIGRDILCDALAKCSGVRFERPRGAFYLFLGLDKYPDTSELGLRLVDDTALVMSPGEAFGDAGAGFLRLCFARDHSDIHIAAERLTNWISTHQ
ncbi:MAG: aminotransferase class I/II-fold pyridoxal phosphate-dependent enzyme, partial [Rhizobiales bacterium]|nr:aminotransferase class I/II-fold pyridoxal phosphate-dependent enzyme [Hyphomicrobiales bacterium]